jgi:hypothetical protein
MKKFALAAVAAAALTAGVAQAYTVGTFSNGLVVPNVIHNGAANTTAVGLVNQSGRTIPVFWTWFDQNSNHGVDGCFPMTNKQYTGFNWAAASGVGMEGKRGYLVFAVGSGGSALTAATACAPANATLADGAGVGAAANTAQLAGNAFYVDVAGKSVAFTPVIDGPLTLAAATNLSTMDALSLVNVRGAATVAATTQLSLRYFIDGTANSGNDTRITVWSTGDQRGTHTVNIYDNAQNRQSVNFPLAESELSWFDPETIAGRPAAFLDGIIEWNPGVTPSGAPAGAALVGPLLSAGGGSVVAYSTIVAPSFGAVQTLLGAHRLSGDTGAP